MNGKMTWMIRLKFIKPSHTENCMQTLESLFFNEEGREAYRLVKF